ncbi:hypothetical protein [Candidatus Nitrosocosmicus hydrocola]|uniref:hypothetical protein n=1 Tax=Candidatus Nitrosocosmicus hydrocola TaxID=1826872 RepID=UPI0011E59159|nr:hypothetical protein [Candidatus Nitrosocosmicus hydrocola]
MNTSKGKMALTLVALASLFVMAFNINANSLNVNAFDIDNSDNKNNIGKSEECVKVVLGCGGQGTVGDNKPIGPMDTASCEECLADLTNAQRDALFAFLGSNNNTDVCSAIETLTADTLLELLLNLDIDLFTALDILECFGAA